MHSLKEGDNTEFLEEAIGMEDYRKIKLDRYRGHRPTDLTDM